MAWSAATLVEPPAEPAIALEAVKEFVRVDADTHDFDAQLTDFAADAVADIEALCSIRLAPQTVEVLADNWGDMDRLPIGPVSEIVSIHYFDAAGAEQLLDSAVYELAGAGLERYVRPAFGAAWPSGLRAVAGAIRMQVEVGYTELPRPLRAAALYLAADMFAFRETAVVGTIGAKVPMSATVEARLTNFRIWL